MDVRACSLVRASAIYVCTIPVRGLGMAACLMGRDVPPRAAHRVGCVVRV